MLVQVDTKKKRKPRKFTMVAQQTNSNPGKVHEAACAAGEDGLYKETEKLSRKIGLRGPSYYFGNPKKKGRAYQNALDRAQEDTEVREAQRDARRSPSCSVSFSSVPPEQWEAIFGRK
jgi:hypothetical protein